MMIKPCGFEVEQFNTPLVNIVLNWICGESYGLKQNSNRNEHFIMPDIQ